MTAPAQLQLSLGHFVLFLKDLELKSMLERHSIVQRRPEWPEYPLSFFSIRVMMAGRLAGNLTKELPRLDLTRIHKVVTIIRV